MAGDDILKIIEDLKKQLSNLSERYKALRQEKSGELRSGQAANNPEPTGTGAATASSETAATNTTQPAPPDRSPQAQNASPAAASGSGIPTTLTGSVGRGGQNNEVDVRAVQERLVRNAIQVTVDGKVGPQTIGAIERFQQHRIGVSDGRVDPNGNTWRALMGQQVPRQTPPPSAAATGGSAAGRIAHPMPNGRMTSPFGMRMHPIHRTQRMHNGIDYAAGGGSRIFAIADGVVNVRQNDPRGYGLWIQIDHGNGYFSRYAHLQSFSVSMGARVTKGQVIGIEGNTGGSTGPHLHFEIRKGSTAVNPAPYISGSKVFP